MDLAEALKAVLRGQGGLVDDKVSLLRCNWIAVTSRAEEWLNLLLVRPRTTNGLCFLFYIKVLKKKLFSRIGLPAADAEVGRTDRGSEWMD